MAKKIQLQDANGNVLHPLTLGECVTMDNGENLDTLMSKSQMFTPTIAQDKSMFKVGTGVDVDYSANVKDGAYESLVFKGKSLVNLCPNGVINYTATSDWDGYNGIGQASNTQGYSWKTLQDLKPNTKYFISCYVETFNVGENQYYLLNNRNDSTVFGESLYIRTTGLHKWVLTSKSEFTEDVHIALRCQNAHARGAIKIRDIMIIECQEGMEEWDIPYFEGLCDSKMPILRNVGKNLLYALDGRAEYRGITLTSSNGKIIVNGTATSNAWVNLQPIFQAGTSPNIGETFLRFNNTTLTLSTNIIEGSLNGNQMSVTLWEKDGTGNRNLTTQVGKSVTRTTTEPIEFKRLWVMFPEGTSYNNVVFTIQLEESSSTTTYEDYKTNILRTSEEVVLREVNGVQDTYNALTGEYVKRIGECVLDGSQALSLDGSLVYLELTDRPINDFGIADKMPVITVNQLVTGEFGICMQDRGASGRIYINIEGLTTREEILQHLRTNPITIHYGLVEPVTTIVKPSTMTPFAYQNGHVIVESGFEGQSLLPEIEYSVVTGRTGQVTQNTKVLRKQEQQIIGLEELLLTQVVQMEYERTLLQFDYELQMMMLG